MSPGDREDAAGPSKAGGAPGGAGAARGPSKVDGASGGAAAPRGEGAGGKRGPKGGKAPALVADGVTKDYGDLVALDHFSVKVARGQTVVVVGPNGSGKTTFVRVAAGLLEPTAGEVRVLGAVAGSLEARSVTSYISDNPVLYDDLSVIEHLEYVARLHGAGDWADRGWAMLERLQLDTRADDLPSRFSRGLRQKAAIALGLCRPFSVLLVDEPFVGLDAPGKAALLGLLDEEAERGASILVATHSMEFVDRADRCLGLRDGTLAYDGPATTAAVQRLVG